MKVGIPTTRPWSLPSIFQLTRGGSQVKRELWNVLAVCLAGLLAIFVFWGPLSAPSFPNIPDGVSTSSASIPTRDDAFGARVRANPRESRTDDGYWEGEDPIVVDAGELQPPATAVADGQTKEDPGMKKVGDNGPVNEESVSDSVLENEEEKRRKDAEPQVEETKEALNFTKWNTTYSFHPKVTDWDQQREQFLANTSARAPVGRKSRVILTTGSSPTTCIFSEANEVLIKSAKNKMDYCREHDVQLFYNLASPDPHLDGWWTKQPVIRMLMLAHPEVEWIWWMDADAWLTDMVFEPPFDLYESQGYNLVLYGNEQQVFQEKSWTGINAGDMLIRNCQWTLDLLDAWASFGLKEISVQAGAYLTETLTERPVMASDDQSGLAYLMLFEKEKWYPKIKLEMSYDLSGYWVTLTARYEELRATSRPGFGDSRWPFVVHFAGCQPCSGLGANYDRDQCLQQMFRSFNFADDIILQSHGFQLLNLNFSEVVPMLVDEEMKEGDGYSLKPKISDWDSKRKVLVGNSAPTRIYKNGRPRVLLISSSSMEPQCEVSTGRQHMLLRAMKNKIDYCRIHDIEMFYNMAQLDDELTGWWSKLPVIKTMMITHPEAEWMWWVDEDAVFTDMDSELPFDEYADFNLVLQGDNSSVFERKSFTGLSTSNFVIRNCQWSLDLLDAMALMGSSGPIRKTEGEMLSNFLADRPQGLEAEDRSALIYMLLTQTAKWAPKVHFETSFAMSGDWATLTNTYEEMQIQYESGTRDHRWPMVTNFSGCQFCVATTTEKDPAEECMEQMGRALHFADNQVVHFYGFKHIELGSYELQKIG